MQNDACRTRGRRESYSNYFNDAAKWHRGLFSLVVVVLSHVGVECAEVCYFNIPAVFDDRRLRFSHVSIFRIKLRSELRVTAILPWIFFLPLEDTRRCNRLNSSRQGKEVRGKGEEKEKRKKEKEITNRLLYQHRIL